MKKEHCFMMLFRYIPDFEYQPTLQEQADIKEQWGTFIGTIAIKEKLVHTYQLGFEGRQLMPDQQLSNEILIHQKQTLSGTMTVKANSIEEVTEMAKSCPILKIGGTVEIRTILPMIS